jgi:CspA family cold shock protein
MSIIKQLFNRVTTTKTHTMKEGTVKFFNRSKGFGFIKPADSDDDVFVHQTGLIDEIHENDNVTFDMKSGEKGMSAVNVKLAN